MSRYQAHKGRPYGKRTGSICWATGKHRYRDLRQAEDALIGIKWIRARFEDLSECRRRESRIYDCDKCNGFHLTSKESFSVAFA